MLESEFDADMEPVNDEVSLHETWEIGSSATEVRDKILVRRNLPGVNNIADVIAGPNHVGPIQEIIAAENANLPGQLVAERQVGFRNQREFALAVLPAITG